MECQGKIIPPHYTVSVSGNLTQYIIVNTYNETFDDSSIDTGTTAVSTDDVSKDTQTTAVTMDTAVQTTPVTSGTVGETQATSTTTTTTTTATPESSEEKLPQTGQLWWPVLPLAGGGLLLLTIGLRRKDNDE